MKRSLPTPSSVASILVSLSLNDTECVTVSVESLSFRRRRFVFYIVQLILLLLYCNFYPGLISPLYYSHNSVPALVVAPALLTHQFKRQTTTRPGPSFVRDHHTSEKNRPCPIAPVCPNLIDRSLCRKNPSLPPIG